MKTHSSPGKTFPVRSIAFAVLISLAVHVQAQEKTAPVEGRVNGILSHMKQDEKLSYISGTGFPNPIGAFNIKGDNELTADLGRTVNLGLPTIYGIDGSVGIVGQGVPPGTRYPSGQLLSATWNPDRAFDEGVAQGREGRARGVHRILGPGVNFYRTALNGRSFEYMTGEDPFLGAVLVAAEVKGKYFNSSDLSGDPVATRVDTHLNFANFDATNVPDPSIDPSNFSGIWTGTVTPTISGDHVFKVSSGGNVKLFVNNQQVPILDSSSPAGTPDTPISAAPPFVPISGKINLRAGVAYNIRLEANNLGTVRLFSAAGLQVSWASLQPPTDLRVASMKNVGMHLTQPTPTSSDFVSMS